MEFSLCGKGSCCPALKIENGMAYIGENRNMVKLKAGEWNSLVKLIKEGKVGEI